MEITPPLSSMRSSGSQYSVKPDSLIQSSGSNPQSDSSKVYAQAMRAVHQKIRNLKKENFLLKQKINDLDTSNILNRDTRQSELRSELQQYQHREQLLYLKNKNLQADNRQLVQYNAELEKRLGVRENQLHLSESQGIRNSQILQFDNQDLTEQLLNLEMEFQRVNKKEMELKEEIQKLQKKNAVLYNKAKKSGFKEGGGRLSKKSSPRNKALNQKNRGKYREIQIVNLKRRSKESTPRRSRSKSRNSENMEKPIKRSNSVPKSMNPTLSIPKFSVTIKRNPKSKQNKTLKADQEIKNLEKQLSDLSLEYKYILQRSQEQASDLANLHSKLNSISKNIEHKHQTLYKLKQAKQSSLKQKLSQY